MNASKKVRTSIGAFDFGKGIGIILVVLSHTFAHLDVTQNPFLFGFDLFLGMMKPLLPMFFLISGYTFKAKPIGKMLSKTFSEMIVPYLWVMVGYAVVFPITYYKAAYGGWIEPTLHRTLQYVIAFLLGIGPIGTKVFGFEVAWNTAAWYLMAFFVSLNIMNLILKIKKESVQILSVILCILLGGLLFNIGFVYFCLPQGLMAVGYCYFGYALKKHALFDKFRSSIWTYIICVPIYFAEIWWGMIDLSQGAFNHMYADYLGAGIAAFMFLCIMTTLARYENALVDGIKMIGMYSFWILAIHSVEMEALPWWYWQRPLADNQVVALILELVIKVVMFVGGCYLLKEIAKRRYRKKILKQNNNNL